jgi:hypothetical protein
LRACSGVIATLHELEIAAGLCAEGADVAEQCSEHRLARRIVVGDPQYGGRLCLG